MQANPFLWQVANGLIEKFGTELYRVAVVFPNRRQSVYFREYLQQQLTVPALLPELLTIEELVTRFSEYALADPVRQSLALYEAYLSVEKEQGNDSPMEYEDFFNIGQILLSDLNEADNNLVPVERLFTIIADYKEIDNRFEELTEEQRSFLETFWASVNLKDPYQQRFADLWRMIPDWYGRMHASLQKEGFSTLGKMYRSLANAGAVMPDAGWKHVAFVGFNAFNGAEEQILKTWQQAGLASLWLDIDTYYLENPMYEAGFFFRRNLNVLGLKNEMPVTSTIPAKGNKQLIKGSPITITRVDGQVVQAKLLEEWVSLLPGELPPGKAAILLADEKLLIPVLQSMPPTKHSINITMGYPLAQSPLFALLSLFFEAQTVLEGQKPGKGAAPWELVLNWLNHPLNDWKAEDIEKQKLSIINKGLQWVSVEPLLKYEGISKWLFTALPDRNNLFTWLRNLMEAVNHHAAVQADSLLQGLLSGLFDSLVSIESIYADNLSRGSLNFLKTLVLTHLKQVSFPFEAERTAGIQVMGLLESRGLDFENILLLGAGEGSLPRVATAKTFIPYNLRKAFGLSTMEHQDAIFAWVFYRLLHRSQHLHAVYNGLVTDNSTGEPSRFLQQLEHEAGYDIVKRTLQLSVKATPMREITITKTAEVMRSMVRYYGIESPVAFSPSAINKYLSCRLQFFFDKLAGIKKPDEMQTEIDPAIFGTAVHNLMDGLYKKWMKEYPGKIINDDAITHMTKWVPELLDTAIQEAWHNKKSTANQLSLKGYAAIARDVVEHFARGFLDIDLNMAPFKVHYTEISFTHELSVRTKDGIRKVLLKGNIDRVDEKDGIVRMVDFKTGGDKPEFYNLDELFRPHGDKGNKGALQTLLYALMFSKNNPEFPQFEPALVVLRQLKNKSNKKPSVQLLEKETGTVLTAEVMDTFLPAVEERMIGLLEELFDADVPFDQTNDLRTCNYCDFKTICGR